MNELILIQGQKLDKNTFPFRFKLTKESLKHCDYRDL